MQKCKLNNQSYLPGSSSESLPSTSNRACSWATHHIKSHESQSYGSRVKVRGRYLGPFPNYINKEKEKVIALAFCFWLQTVLIRMLTSTSLLCKMFLLGKLYPKETEQKFFHGTQSKSLVTIFRTRGAHYYKLFIVNELYKDLFPTVVAFAMAFNILFPNYRFALKRIIHTT